MHVRRVSASSVAAHRRTGRPRSLALLLAAQLIASSCAPTLERQLTAPQSVETLDRKARFLKAHMLDGSVYVLEDWRASATRVSGEGKLLAVDRSVVERGFFGFPIDSVALFETNSVKGMPPAVTALSILTVASLGMAIYCASEEKACFGSCPTFYVEGDEEGRLQAEGFSAAVSPALEATDLDALYRAVSHGRELRLRMTNEALETHVVRSLSLLAAPRPAGGRVFATRAGELWRARRLIEPRTCSAPEGDCRERVSEFDGVERFSHADSADLAAREHLDLEFTAAPGTEVGVVVAARQTLLSTFLFYQGLAYMGTAAGHWLAALERGDANLAERAGGIGAALGRIEVMRKDGAGGWVVAGEVGETGPLATDVQIVPVGRVGDGPLRVRLRLTRGLWRLDWIGAAVLDGRTSATRLAPIRVLRRGEPDREARARVLDARDALITLPGDSYTFVFELPDDAERQELFVEARGYYLEWMREEWLAEEDAAKAALMFMNPATALRVLAPAFKRVEPRMEELFWRSRYVRR